MSSCHRGNKPFSQTGFCSYCFSPGMDLSGCAMNRNPCSRIRCGGDSFALSESTINPYFKSDQILNPPVAGYSGAIPGSNQSFGCTSGKKLETYLQARRNHILTKTARPTAFYGRLPANFTPLPDIAMCASSTPWNKLVKAPDLNNKGLDAGRMMEIHGFHTLAVQHRDYYLDKYEKQRPVDYFDVGRPWPVRCFADERSFKRTPDPCDKPGYVGFEPRALGLKCVRDNCFLDGFDTPKLPRPPFRCCCEEKEESNHCCF